MKFTAHRADLARTLAVITKALPRSARRPEDAGVTLTVSDGAVTLRATDFELWADAGLDAMIGSTDGTVVMPGHVLADWVASERAELVTIDTTLSSTGGGILCTGKRRLTVPPLRVEALDGIRHAYGPDSLGATVDAAALSGALKRLAPCADSKGIFDPIFGAVHLATDGQRLQLTATDKYQIARLWIDADPLDAEFEATPPLRRFADLAAALSGDVTLTTDAAGERLSVIGEGASFAGATIYGTYPRVDHMVTPSGPHVTRVDARQLRDEIAGVARVAARLASASHTRVRLHASGGELLVSAASPDSTHAIDGQLDGAPIEADGDAMDLDFNAAFLVGALGALAISDGDVVLTHYGTAPKPTTLTAADGPLDAVATVMPMRRS